MAVRVVIILCKGGCCCVLVALGLGVQGTVRLPVSQGVLAGPWRIMQAQKDRMTVQ